LFIPGLSVLSYQGFKVITAYSTLGFLHLFPAYPQEKPFKHFKLLLKDKRLAEEFKLNFQKKLLTKVIEYRII